MAINAERYVSASRISGLRRVCSMRFLRVT